MTTTSSFMRLPWGTALLGILNDILDYSRIESGHLRLEQAPFDLNALIATLQGFFAQAAASKGLTLELDVDPGVPRTLRGDALRLQQVLANLLGNAIKFTDQGRVSLRVRDLDPGADPAHLHWSVTDTGIGMDATARARLFEPFLQGDESIARRFGGTGLGLSITRELVVLMGGNLVVNSVPAQGSTFAFDLHLALGSAPHVPEARAAPLPALAREARLLVAEDQPINQRVVANMLRLLGLGFTLVSDGQEALDALASAPQDLVLMDIQMPGMDGLSATRAIRANPLWAKLPVIALTAGVTEAERAEITAAGFNDLLPKPVTLATLKAMLGRWIPVAEPAVELELPARAQPVLSLAGFDLSQLRQIVEDDAEISDLLRQFAASVRDDIDTIASALDGADSARVAQIAHRLKGVAGNVGAVALQDAARHLETALQSDSATLDDALRELRRAHAQALEQVAGLAVPDAPEMVSAEGDPEAARELLGELRTLMHQSRFISPNSLVQLRAVLPVSTQSAYRALVDCLDQMNYPEAEQYLDALERALVFPGTSDA